MEFRLLEGGKVFFIQNPHDKYGVAVREREKRLNLLASYQTREELEKAYTGWLLLSRVAQFGDILPFERIGQERFQILTEIVEEHEKFSC